MMEIPMSYIKVPDLAYPKSAYIGHEYPLPRCNECTVLEDILKEAVVGDDNVSDTFLEAELKDFSIYRPHRIRPHKGKALIEGTKSNEMVSLHEINEAGVQNLFFDGVICNGGNEQYLQRVPFSVLSVGGYEDVNRCSIGADVWIQSLQGKRLEVWYRLCSPSLEYRQYHWTFLWMGDLGKHVVDFLYTHDEVLLHDFRALFYDWLKATYSCNSSIDDWLNRYGDRDFRRMIVNQASYLFCQALLVDHSYSKHPLWSEIHPRDLCAVPEQIEESRVPECLFFPKEAGTTTMRRKTTVTPYVFKCFQHLPWAKLLYAQARLPSTQTRSLTSKSFTNTRVLPSWQPVQSASDSNHISVGDVVAIPSDAQGTWKHQGAEWYAYVQDISCTERGSKLGLLWLYRPVDTACMKMPYPYAQELFLSDHCNCSDPPIYAHEVIRKPCIAFFGEPETSLAEFFCRQHYQESNGAWITLSPSHFRCPCDKRTLQLESNVGDTVLIAVLGSPHKTTLEPAVIAHIDHWGESVVIRRLLRKRRDCGAYNAALNELVYTNYFDFIPPKKIIRKCHIRFYTTQERDQGRIPAPYNRHGMADCYFITSKKNDHFLEPLRQPWPSDLIEGWDPLDSPSRPPLRGLDLFCGGGNFSRGLEEGGAVDFRWAVDRYNEAIHSYKANARNASEVKLFRGSVNQYLSEALEGNLHGGLIAQRGQVDFIAAGSPCPGFSSLNPNKGNDRSLFDQSMVASVIAFIDFYKPRYALLENVKGMATGGAEKSALAAVICALVGMNYQVRTFALDAWSFGSAQSRSRIFISVAAPGLTPLPEPSLTHSHPEDVIGGNLGKTANGLPTGARYTTPTPFSYVSAIEATKDLPSTEARLSSIRYPDHRMSRNMSTLNRVRMSCIPRFPGGSGFLAAHARNFMPQVQLDNYSWSNRIRAEKTSKAWSRLKRNKLMPTITTQPRPDDGVAGTCLHWNDHRLLTILEARRAQGFPDHEVIVGSIADQWKIVGNSVARPVALALGMSLREAWLANRSLEKYNGFQ